MIDSKQFIIANTIFKKEDWLYITLSCGKILSYHKELNICHNADNSVILLGHAWSVLPIEEQVPPSSFVENMNRTLTEEEIIKEEKTWCGRYVLIANDNIYLDTIGSLGIYYHQCAISSSINVLCQHLAIPFVFPDLKQGDQPPFLPGMQTGYNGILRLMPSQILDIANNTYHIRKLLPDGYIKLKLALTGGRDSRTALALLEYTKIPYDVFSLQHPHISDGDIFLPVKLSKIVGKKLNYIKRKNHRDLTLYDDFHTHCSGFAFDEDWDFYSCKQYQELLKQDKDIVVLRSGVWSIQSSVYMYSYEGRYDLLEIFPSLKYKKDHLNSAEEWVKYAKNDTINKEINIWDRTYWEFDNTCWLAPIEQSLDIIDHITFIQPANCRRFISIMYGFDEKYKKNKILEELINPKKTEV